MEGAYPQRPFPLFRGAAERRHTMEDEKIIADIDDNSMKSNPVNLENPGFDSLLSALKAVHTGEMGMDVLRRYHEGLTALLDSSRDDVASMEVPEQFKELIDAQMRMTFAALDIVRVTLDFLRRYIDTPSDEAMAQCIDSFMNSQSVMASLNAMLDANARAAQ